MPLQEAGRGRPLHWPARILIALLTLAARPLFPSGGSCGISDDTVVSPGCWKNRSDEEILFVLKGDGAHPFPCPEVCGEVVETVSEARTILGTGGSSPCNKFRRDLLTTIFNIRHSILLQDGTLGQDIPKCFGVGSFRIVLSCNGFFVPDTGTTDPDDAIAITEETPLEQIIAYSDQLCDMASCPPTNQSPCGRTINDIASKLNQVNASPSRHGECGGTCQDSGAGPVLTCPTGTLTFECTGPDGAPIDYDVTASDDCDPNPTLSCFPPPGTVLPTGTMRTVTCTASDDSGNSSSCSFKVMVVDTARPMITCPDGPIVVDCVAGNGQNGAVVNYPPPVATDLCDEEPAVTCDPPSGSVFPFGTTTVKCTATDASGNMAMCTFDVIVVEDTPPTLTCPGDITTECTGPDGAVVEYPPPMVSMTCNPPPAPACSPPSGSTFPIGTTTVTCRTTSGGQDIQCQFTVAVRDTVPPVLTVPQDVVVECSSPGGSTVGYEVSATDTCDPDPHVTCDPPSGSFFPVGQTTVNCTAMDHHENSTMKSFQVTVRDTTPPEISCPQGPIRVACTMQGPPPGAVVNYPSPVVSDQCDSDVMVTCAPPSGSVFPLGRTTVTCTATDGSGNSASCSFDVEVVDEAPPSIVCPSDFFVECTSDEGAVVEYPTPVAADDCDVEPTVTCSPPSGSFFPMGTTMVTCTAVDDSGSRMSCSFQVTVTDSMPPMIICPSDKVVECAGPAGTPVEFSASATDACDPEPDVVCDPPSGTSFPLGSTVVTCMATDDSGNTSRCQFSVGVVDTIAPVIRCPDPIVAECRTPQGTEVTYTASAEDRCETEVTLTCDPPSGSVFPPGETTVTCTAMDSSGNSSRCQFTVTVVDTTPPTITCPADAVVVECMGSDGGAAMYPTPVASDNCDPDPEVVCDPPPNTVLPVGMHTVNCTAKDASGNMSSCSFQVKVVDTTPPDLMCIEDITRECQGPDGAVVEYPPPKATDTCSPAPNLVCLPASGSLFPIGETTVTCTADDQNGNMVQCTFKVTVVDTHPPNIQCPGDMMVLCTSGGGTVVNYTATATDDCDPNPSLNCEPPSGQVFPIGKTTVTCVARDRANNESSCSFMVMVVDAEPPSITCPPDFETDCMMADKATIVYPPPAVSDNCDPNPTVVCDPPSGTKLPRGSHVIRCTATDAAGNESSCEFMVRIVDDTPPALVCPRDQTAECTSPDGTPVNYPPPMVTDACDSQPVVVCNPPSGSSFQLGTTEVFCRAKDAAGNEMTCSFTVTVVDTTPPQINCPLPITAECTSPDGANVEFQATATDTCDAVPELVCTPPSGSLFPIGQSTVTCTATDDEGNRSECSFTVTVVDTTPPVIECPPDIIVEGTTAGNPPHKPPGWPPGSNPPANAITAVFVYEDPTATDLCQTEPPSVMCDPPSGTRLGFGMHTITCKARDRAGNEATCTFKVTVVLGLRAFVRSDSNSDGSFDIADPIATLNFLFLGGPEPRCEDSADANDDGGVNMADAVYTINYLFMGGLRPPEPYGLCNLDPTADEIGCNRYAPCE